MDVLVESDARLAESCRNGDKEAFTEIVDRYKTLICSITYAGTGNLARSEELAQETFLIAWRRLDTLREPPKLRAWLAAIARNLVRGQSRKERHEPSSIAEPLETHPEICNAQPTPAEYAISKEEQDLLWRALENIPELYREPMVLFYRQGQSIRAVAEQLDLSDAVVKKRLSRGRKRLRAEMTGFIENALEQSKPRKTFTAAVLGVISVAGAREAAAVTTGAGASVAGASLGAFLGPLEGVAGGLYGAWSDYRRAESPRERRLVVIFTAVLFAYIAIWLVSFPLLDRWVNLRTPAHREYLMAWLGLGIGCFGAISGIFMSLINRARLQARGIDVKALESRPMLIEPNWKPSTPGAISLRRAAVGIVLAFAALVAAICLWTAVEHSLLKEGRFTSALPVAMTVVTGVILALWTATSPKLKPHGRRFYALWIPALTVLLAAHLAAVPLLQPGTWKNIEQSAYCVLTGALVLFGILHAQRLEKRGLIYVRPPGSRKLEEITAPIPRGNALVQIYAVFIGGTCWMFVLAAIIGDWATLSVLAAAMVALPAMSLRIFSPRYRVVMLAITVAAAVVNLAAVNLRWHAWMTVYRDSRFYSPASDVPLSAINLLLAVMFTIIIAMLVKNIVRESVP